MSEPTLSSSDRELIDLGAQMITGWWRLTMQALFDTVGCDKAMEIMAPNIKANARSSVINTRERLEKLGYRDCPDWILSSVMYQFQHLVLRRTFKDNEIMTKGGRGGEITSCPFQHDSVDICRFLCDMMARYVVSAINPDLEFIPGKKLTEGAPFCDARLFYKGKPMTSEGETIAVVRRLNLPTEVLDYYLFAWMGEMWAMACNSAMEFFGEEGTLELLRPYMKQNGMATALQLKQRLRLEGKNAQTIGEIIDYCNAAVQQKGRILVSSPNHFEKEITECPFFGMSHPMCSGLLTARSGGICNAINPDFEFLTLQRMCKGDKVCRWVVKKRI